MSNECFDIEIKNLTKVFRDFWCRPKVRAVDGLDVAVRKGEIFGLLGPNGSGKSTVMKMLLGLLRPTKGSIRVLGNSPKNVRTKNLIGYLPEESLFCQHLTAREALHFYGGLFSLSGKTIKSRTEELLNMAGLTNAADRPIREFSRGMARRLGLAQSLINDPQLLLLDEPTAGLDPMGCHQVKDLLRALAARGRTILLCSHLLADVEDMCDRVAILHNGRLLADGTINELLASDNKILLSLPDTSANKLDEIRMAIRRITGTQPEIKRPLDSLESFFVRIVHEAKTNDTTQQPDPGSNELAAFLKEDITS